VSSEVVGRLSEAVDLLEAQMQVLREENRIFRETLQKLAVLLMEQQMKAKQGNEEVLRTVREIAGRKGLLGRLFS
jgi:regulator of replication initiation timing